MITPGKYNTLEVLGDTEHGKYLTDEEGNKVVLLKQHIPEDIKDGDQIDVFIYKDGNDQYAISNSEPKITLESFALLKAKAVGRYGAFMDWGIEKDLLIPYSEQSIKIEEESSHIVYMYFDDESERLVGSTRVDEFLEQDEIELEIGQEVNLLIRNKSDLGLNVIINDKYAGLVYQNEIFKSLRSGDRTTGFVRKIREDNKIDVALRPFGYTKVKDDAEKLLEALNENDGYLPFTDKSDAYAIKSRFQISKKVFKKAVGRLYKQKLIFIKEDGIYLRKMGGEM